MRQRVADWLESSFVRNGIIAVIVFNAVILGFETSQGMMNAAVPPCRCPRSAPGVFNGQRKGPPE